MKHNGNLMNVSVLDGNISKASLFKLGRHVDQVWVIYTYVCIGLCLFLFLNPNKGYKKVKDF
jgi:hypothetical protein